MSKIVTLATAVVLVAAATSLASAGVIMPARSIGASGMHSPPSDRLSFSSSIRTQSGLVDPNVRKSQGSAIDPNEFKGTQAVDPASRPPLKGHRKSKAGYDLKLNKKI